MFALLMNLPAYLLGLPVAEIIYIGLLDMD